MYDTLGSALFACMLTCYLTRYVDSLEMPLACPCCIYHVCQPGNPACGLSICTKTLINLILDCVQSFLFNITTNL